MKSLIFVSSLLFFQNCIADIILTPHNFSLTPEHNQEVIMSDVPSEKMLIEIIVDPSSTADLAVYQCEETPAEGITTTTPHIIKPNDNKPYLCAASYHSVLLKTQANPLSQDKITGRIIKHYSEK